MDSKNMWKLLLPLVGGILIVTLAWSGLARPSQATAAAAFTRADEVVVVQGESLTQMLGFPLDELGVFALNSGVWTPIPFQVDEVNITGTFVIEEDGLLDENDELVFVAGDMGEAASPHEWINNLGSWLYPRIRIEVTDPLNPGETGWVYVYRSTTLPQSNASYVNWNPDTETISADAYSVTFDQQNFLGISDLTIGGSGDILDRQKIRVTATPLDPVTEETLADLLEQVGLPNTLAIAALGPVRAATGNLDAGIGFAFYGSRFDLDVTFPLSDTYITYSQNGLTVTVLLQFQSAFTSLDLLNPTETGMAPATYYDPNMPDGVAIDGVADNVPVSPWHEYSVVSGQLGTIVDVMEVDRGQGHIRNFYIDDSALDDTDTGDGRSYGNAGIGIERANFSTEIGLIRLNQRFYILPGAQGNVGEEYVAKASTPLTVMTEGEVNPHANFIYLPAVARP